MVGTARTEAARSVPGNDCEEDLSWALGALLRSLQRGAREVVSDLPGGVRGLQVLSMATDGPCRTQAAMAARLGVDRTVMTHLVDDLEEQGLVVRRPHPDDRRARRVELTTTGRSVYDRLAAQVRDVERDVLSELSDADAQLLRDLVRRAATAVDDGASPVGADAADLA